MYIAVDFDGTIVEAEYPKIGREIEGAVSTLKYLISMGHKIILFTCRQDKELIEAIDWCLYHGIDLFDVGTRGKVYADLYIDDKGFGTPKRNGWVDWGVIRAYFERRKVF